MLTHRLQILIDDERHALLRHEADRRQVPIAVVVREAIDMTYGVPHQERSAAIRDILAAEPMPVPEPDELRAELDEIRAGGL